MAEQEPVTLGVAMSLFGFTDLEAVTEELVNSTYRAKAKGLHPDANHGSEADTTEAFNQLGLAKTLLLKLLQDDMPLILATQVEAVAHMLAEAFSVNAKARPDLDHRLIIKLCLSKLRDLYNTEVQKYQQTIKEAGDNIERLRQLDEVMASSPAIAKKLWETMARHEEVGILGLQRQMQQAENRQLVMAYFVAKEMPEEDFDTTFGHTVAWTTVNHTGQNTSSSNTGTRSW